MSRREALHEFATRQARPAPAKGRGPGQSSFRVPNSTTISAMKELDDAKGRRFDSAEELFRDLDM